MPGVVCHTKGMSVAVNVFFMKGEAANTLEKEVYFTILERCDQKTTSTMCPADHILQQFTADYPNKKKINIKSDNAGCYAGNSRAEASYGNCEKIH